MKTDSLPEETINTRVKLDFEQRARAVRLENAVSDDEHATAAEIIWLRDENERLREALRIVAEGTICPELFPDLDMERDEWELTAKTAAVSAIAALEPRA